MNESLLSAFQKQINAELYSSYLYLAMSSWLDGQTLKGCSNWMRVQAREELFHATYMHDFLLRRGMPSVMSAIVAPPNAWRGIEDVFEQVCNHEKSVTESINNIATVALEVHDHAAYQFIMQYVNEQVEEEETSQDILNKIKFSQGKPEYLYALDNELSARIYRQPFGTPTP